MSTYEFATLTWFDRYEGSTQTAITSVRDHSFKNYTTEQEHRGILTPTMELLGKLSREGWRIVAVGTYPTGAVMNYQLQREVPQALYEEKPPPHIRSYAIEVDGRKMWVDDRVIPFDSLSTKVEQHEPHT